jgi:hypothetical protein
MLQLRTADPLATTGAGFGATVMVAMAVADPPFPSLIV